jgi:pentose-5-phosphate-3-epimerase
MVQIRANVVSRFLSANGFSRSVTSATRIRGWNTWTTGYEATLQSDGKVRVMWTMGSRSGQASSREIADKQAAMRTVLERRYTVEIGVDGFFNDREHLLVSAKQS